MNEEPLEIHLGLIVEDYTSNLTDMTTLLEQAKTAVTSVLGTGETWQCKQLQ